MRRGLEWRGLGVGAPGGLREGGGFLFAAGGVDDIIGRRRKKSAPSLSKNFRRDDVEIIGGKGNEGPGPCVKPDHISDGRDSSSGGPPSTSPEPWTGKTRSPRLDITASHFLLAHFLLAHFLLAVFLRFRGLVASQRSSQRHRLHALVMPLPRRRRKQNVAGGWGWGGAGVSSGGGGMFSPSMPPIIVAFLTFLHQQFWHSAPCCELGGF